MQHYIIKFVSDLWQVGGFLRVLWFPPPIKLTPRYSWNILKVALNTIILNHSIILCENNDDNNKDQQISVDTKNKLSAFSIAFIVPRQSWSSDGKKLHKLSAFSIASIVPRQSWSSDGKTLHHYQQNEQPPHTSNHWMETRRRYLTMELQITIWNMHKNMTGLNQFYSKRQQNYITTIKWTVLVITGSVNGRS